MPYYNSTFTNIPVTTSPLTSVIPLTPVPANSYMDKLTLTFDEDPTTLSSVKIGFSNDPSGSSPIFFRYYLDPDFTNNDGIIQCITDPIFLNNNIQSIVVEIVSTSSVGNIGVFYNQLTLPLLHPANNLVNTVVASQTFIVSLSPQAFTILPTNTNPIKIKSMYTMFDAVVTGQAFKVGNSVTGLILGNEKGVLRRQSLELCGKTVINPSGIFQLYQPAAVATSFQVNYVITYSVVT